MDEDKVLELFTYHKPFGDQASRYESIRAIAKEFAVHLLDVCPDSPERTVAIQRLQESVMWANASIAVNEKE